MPGGRGNIKPSDNPKPFKKGDIPNPKGRPISIRNQIREILAMDGTMKIKPEHVKKINDDGSVEILMPKKDMVAIKLMQWAMSNKETASVRSLQIILENIDGKPHGSTTVDFTQPINQVNLTDAQVQKILEDMKPKKE